MDSLLRLYFGYSCFILIIWLPILDYDFTFDKYGKWANIDVALVKVETPYDFRGTKTSQVCSWVPGPIEISFDPKHMEPGRDAMVLGWGHAERWRKVII